MAFKILEWLWGKTAKTDPVVVSCADFGRAAVDFALRNAAFEACANLNANALSLCEFQTFRKGKPIREREYYLLNVEPNSNQSKTQFFKELIYKLYNTNEALVLSLSKGDHDMLVVADSFQEPKKYPKRMNEYSGVTVGEVSFDKTFKESDVLHLRLNAKNVKAVTDALYVSYSKLIQTAETAISWSQGKHIIAKVDQLASTKIPGSEKTYGEEFSEMITKNMRSFLQDSNSVLPQFRGWEYIFPTNMPKSDITTKEIKSLYTDIFEFTAWGFGIPSVLITGDVADSKNAVNRWLTTSIDPLAQQLEEEINRKRYGYDAWRRGDFVHVDTSTIAHFDLFDNATNVEKLIGSGCFSINELLMKMGLAEIHEDWASKHFMTKNIDTVQNATASINTGEGG